MRTKLFFPSLSVILSADHIRFDCCLVSIFSQFTICNLKQKAVRNNLLEFKIFILFRVSFNSLFLSRKKRSGSRTLRALIMFLKHFYFRLWIVFARGGERAIPFCHLSFMKTVCVCLCSRG